jgi:hypothetical protein
VGSVDHVGNHAEQLCCDTSSHRCSYTSQDVISSINTAHNLGKYSEPAAREELENRIKKMARSIEAGGETQ